MSKRYVDEMKHMQFSEEQKARMVDKLQATADAERATARFKAVRPPASGGKRRWQYAAATAAAVVLAVGLGGGAYASGALMGVANVFDDTFGGAPAQTEVADKIGRPIGASATSKGVTVTAEAIIGDRSNCVVVFSVAKVDGTPFEGVEALENGALPLGFEGSGMLRIDGASGGGGSAGFHDADPSDNALQYVQRMSVDTIDGAGVIGKTARVNLQNLSLYGDGEPRLIAEGTWKMKFVVDYEDTSVDLPAGQSFNMNGMDATIDSIAISPLAVTVEYTVDGVMRMEKQESGRLSERNEAAMSRFEAPVSVTMKDGTVVDASNGAGTRSEEDGTTVCRTATIFEEFVNLDDVASITVGGVEMPFAH